MPYKNWDYHVGKYINHTASCLIVEATYVGMLFFIVVIGFSYINFYNAQYVQPT